MYAVVSEDVVGPGGAVVPSPPGPADRSRACALGWSAARPTPG